MCLGLDLRPGARSQSLVTQQRGLQFVLLMLTLPDGMRAMEVLVGKGLKGLVSNRTLLEWIGR